MSASRQHRLDGLEPDNLLAFLALLGMLRALEAARPAWLPRVSWTVYRPPVRPVLHLAEAATEQEVAAALAAGLAELAPRHDFSPMKDLKLSSADATERLRTAARADRYTADLWAALVSDAATRDRNKQREAEPTPLCLLFGQGHQHFLERLGAIPQETTPPSRGGGRSRASISETECLSEALFSPWTRPDDTKSFRWDPQEDVRYALRATDPTDSKTRETTQHGANRLAAIGLSVLTVAPRRRGPDTRLELLGGSRDRGSFCVTWPIWEAPISLAAIRALLGHTGLDDAATRTTLGVADRRRTRRVSAGKFMNFTRAESI